MTLTFTSAVVVTFLLLWFVSSILVQVAYLCADRAAWLRVLRLCNRWDCLALLPRWTFFSTVPSFDFAVAYRDRRDDGFLSEWRMHEMPGRSAFRFIWNPGRRNRKAVHDLCTTLQGSLAAELSKGKGLLETSFRFQKLEDYVSQIAVPCGEFRQFMVLKIFGGSQATVQILFVSAPFRQAK